MAPGRELRRLLRAQEAAVQGVGRGGAQPQGTLAAANAAAQCTHENHSSSFTTRFLIQGRRTAAVMPMSSMLKRVRAMAVTSVMAPRP